jgi:hypothetical protein
MRLLRQLFVPVMMLVAASCSDTTSPARLTQGYTLTSIDGRSVPVVDTLITGTLIVTTESGTLQLYEDGTATTLTHLHRVDVGLDSLDYTDSTTAPYQIRQDSIVIGATGACRDICPVAREGEFTNVNVTLTDKLTPHSSPIFRYTIIRDAPN